MEIREAVQQAKRYIVELFKEEEAKDVGLEEIEFDGATGTWRVTVGFSRPWDSLSEQPFVSMAEMLKPRNRVREMKVVTLDDAEGKVLSVKNRE